LVVGVIAGWLAGQIVRGIGFGLLGDSEVIVGDPSLVPRPFSVPRLATNAAVWLLGEFCQSAARQAEPAKPNWITSRTTNRWNMEDATIC
jgi:hypothetical protein